MRIAVIGGDGFLGRHVARALEEAGHRVVVLGRRRGIDAGGDAAALAAALAGCDAIVNLVGVKREVARSTFERAHVGVPTRIIEAARIAGVTRIVHVSVAGCRDTAAGPYLESKWRGEGVIRGSGLAWTILRPGVVFGTGDDLLRNVASMLRHAPFFPAPGGGSALLQPIAVEDVAEAVAVAVADPASVGTTRTLVGPERLTLRALAERCAAALGVRVRVVPAPLGVLRAVAAGLERTADPPVTRAQLGLLAEGVIGDVGELRALGIEGRALDTHAIAAASAGVGPWLGISLRAVDRPALTRGLADEPAVSPRRWALLVTLAVLVPLSLGWLFGNVWKAMPTAYLALVPLALWTRRPSLGFGPGPLARGLAAAGVLYIAGWIFVAAASAISPTLRGEIDALYHLVGAAPAGPMALALLSFVIVGEEVVWRSAVLIPLASRMGPITACLVASGLYATAHATAGSPLLALLALAAGSFWSILALRSRGLVTPLVSHLIWDLAVLYAAPYR